MCSFFSLNEDIIIIIIIKSISVKGVYKRISSNTYNECTNLGASIEGQCELIFTGAPYHEDVTFSQTILKKNCCKFLTL